MSLVSTLRRMTGVASDQYQVNGAEHWTDQQLADVLGQHVSGRLLQAPVGMITTLEDGRVVYKHGRIPQFAGTLDPESVEVFDFTGRAIDAEEWTAHEDGRLDFDVDQVGKTPLVSALAYDLNAAAADVLTEWASAISEGYDVSVDGQSLSRSQRHKQKLEQAKAFRAKALPRTVRLTRRDVKGRPPSTLSSRLRPWYEQWGR